MVEYMFEKFNVPKLYIGAQSVLALFASGKTTGLVLDSVDGLTRSVPVFEGFSTNYIHKLITESGYMLGKEFSNKIKEDCGYVAFTE